MPLGTLRLAGADLHPHAAPGAHAAPLPLRGDEGAQPPASLRRGRAKRGPTGYAGSPPLAAPNEPLGRARERTGSTRRVIAVPPGAANRVSMSVPPHAYATVQRAQGLRRESPGEGEAVSPRNTFARMLNNCFGVSMPERWRAARKQVNPSENSTVPERPRSCHASQPQRMPPPVAGKNTPRNVSPDLPRSSARRFVGQPGPEAQKGPDRPNRGPDRCASPRNLPVSSISMTRWVT